MLTDLGIPLFNGLFSAMAVFLFATGLTLVLGILRILNFSHGGFFMIGAYLAFSMMKAIGGDLSLAVFIAACVGAGLAMAVLGLVVERLVFRRLRGVDETYSLIATYALLLMTEGAVKLIWGVNFLSSPTPAALTGAIHQGDLVMPYYALFVIAIGFVTYVALEWIVHRTTLGKLMQSVAYDPWMAHALGVNVPRFYAGIIIVGFFLAGMAGGLLVPNQSLSPNLANVFVIQAFGVLIVGGMGSIRGAFLASLVLCIVDSLGSVYLPQLPGIFFYVAMAALLLIRPHGIIASAEL